MAQSNSEHTYTIKEAARLLNLGERSVYESVREKTFGFPFKRIGNRIIIPRKPIDDFLGIRPPDGEDD